MQIFYKNAAMFIVYCLLKLKEKLIMLLLLGDFSHNVTVSLTFINAAATSVVKNFNRHCTYSAQRL